ncbi:MAG: aminotransferase class III-fold pyridoxal phosphate-dependent enzyme [Desulfobacterales bacterium]|jgi:4-aminobutyrate aminotransferase-like enzyme/Ser/Thr protein kinase RdoA (MazF antagonist)
MSLLKHTPQFTEQDAVSIAKDLYGVRATAKPLPSERDQNFRMSAGEGGSFVLKMANALEDRTMLECQNQAMRHLARHVAFCPKVVSSKSGDLLSEVQSSTGESHMVRLVTYLPGIPMGSVKRHSAELLEDLGRCVGEMDRAMVDFDHPGAHRDFYWDLAKGLEIVKEYQALIPDANLRKLIEKFALDYEQYVTPLLPDLRKSVIHNDANDYNVIVGGNDDLYTRNQQVVGVIDFGDMVYSHTVGNLAIAVAYAILDKSDPLRTASHMLKGYHRSYPLAEDEIASLYLMVCMRLCMSACIAAHQLKQRPDNAYLAISQLPIQRTLPALAETHPRFAEAAFRQACDLTPLLHSRAICNGLKRNRDAMAPVLDIDLRTAPLKIFDLSVASSLVHGNPEKNTEPYITKRLWAEMQAANAKAGIGRYNEARMLYTSPLFVRGNVPTAEHRAIHIGIDLFAETGAAVHAPIAGKVFAFSNNDAPQDYGPVVILEHTTDKGAPFYTLFGHLSPDSLEGLYAGKPIACGERFGRIGAADVNGGWTPHLHFQIITDLLDMGCDFPGVVRAGERNLWTEFSPDPNLIIGIPHDRFPATDPSVSDTLAARRKYIGRNLSIGYRNPLKMVRGWRQYLFDDTSRRYLDAYNNIPHVGHCHPRVVEAASRQMSVLSTNTRYLHDLINRYAERLCATMPASLSVCFFVNSASEGNELALRLARAYTGQRDMIVLEAAYHGNTTSLIDISPYKHEGPGGKGPPAWVHKAPIPDLYRGLYRSDDSEAARKYAGHVDDIIQELKDKGIGLAGFIAETCPSVAGQIFLPQDYLPEVYRHVRKAGGLCIADEVQTGYGRIGTHFYAFEAENLVPDIVVLGKPIGNGHPISAVVTTPEIAETFDNGMEFFSSFGGNTVSCAVGLTVLEVVLEENLQANALKAGKRLLAGMKPFIERYPIVGDVRGSGLFLGIELVRSRETLEPAKEEAEFIVNRMRDAGILLGTDGPFENVIKIRPPMPFDESNADLLVTKMEQILEEDFWV